MADEQGVDYVDDADIEPPLARLMDTLAFDTAPPARRLIELLKERGWAGWTKLERVEPVRSERCWGDVLGAVWVLKVVAVPSGRVPGRKASVLVGGAGARRRRSRRSRVGAVASQKASSPVSSQERSQSLAAASGSLAQGFTPPMSMSSVVAGSAMSQSWQYAPP